MEESTNKEEFLAKYGDVKVQLDSYYKYAFTFHGSKAGETSATRYSIIVRIGGSADDIYRAEISAYKNYTIKELEELAPIYYAEVTDGGDIVYVYS